MLSTKNASISQGLGFGQGDDLLAQVEQQILERRNRATTPTAPAGYGMTGIGTTPAPGSGLSPALQGLLGQGLGNG